MRSWHDYHLVGYSVDGRSATLAFEVRWPYATETDVKAATIMFSGVVGYVLENDLGSNILYGIEERPLGQFLTEQRSRFEESQRWGWPTFWKGTVEETLSDLATARIKCFDVSSSYGLSGWVLANEVTTREGKA